MIYKVGGCVRDKILGITPKDIDYVYVSENKLDVNKSFSEMVEYLKLNNYEIFLSNPEYFTVRAKNNKSHMVYDFVLARKEIYNTTRQPYCVPGTLYDDLERRDFTINALAEDDFGNIIDYFNGIQDIKDRVLKTPTDPLKSFNDDPLRLIRCIRFNITKDFKFSKEVETAFNNPLVWVKLKHTVSIERIYDELFKCFSHNTIRTLRMLNYIDKINPNILENIFGNSLWIKPTLEKKNKKK
jgi:poly(A) polymerase